MLTQLFAVGFYHFLLEIVPRLLIARKFAPTAPLLLPSDGERIHGFIQTILQLLGYDESRILRYVLMVQFSQLRMDTYIHAAAGSGSAAAAAAAATSACNMP